jgi:hypothetical protein
MGPYRAGPYKKVKGYIYFRAARIIRYIPENSINKFIEHVRKVKIVEPRFLNALNHPKILKI